MKAIAIRCAGITMAALLSFGAFAAGKNNPSAGNNGLPGTIRATDSSCTVINGTGFASKDDVYVKAVSSNNGGSMLSDGNYYVRVTDTSGSTVLGSSGANAIAHVLTGKINGAPCLQLDSLVGGSYQDTPNPGGNYKVWFATTPDFAENTSKTDTFKVGTAPTTDNLGSITILKFYDANVNGTYDDTEGTLAWQVQVDGLQTAMTPVTYAALTLGDYTTHEYEPAGNSLANAYSWVATNAYQVPGTWNFDGPDGAAPYLNRSDATLTTDAPDVTVVYGNVCIGPATGGRSIGYWTNKNGQNDMTRIGMSNALTNLGLLVDAKGHYVTFSTYKAFQTWLKNATATNMSYMLSAQKAALKLAVLTGTLNYSDNVYIAGAPTEWGANPAGFISIGQLLAYTENQLSLNPYVRAGISLRTELEILKNAIERIDLNKSAFAQPTPDGCGALAF